MSGVVPSHSSRESHTSTFFMPRHEILVVGTYSVTYVLLSFRFHSLSDHYLYNRCTHSTQFDRWMCHVNIQVEFEFISLRWFLTIMPLEVKIKEKNKKFSPTFEVMHI